jgi:hypothetical protein
MRRVYVKAAGSLDNMELQTDAELPDVGHKQVRVKVDYTGVTVRLIAIVHFI